jgi:leucyl-tRNA synthetase
MQEDKPNFREIEKKWQKRFKDEKLGEANRDESKPKYFLIWAYTTVSGHLHTGHMRGYSYADAIVRYKKMRGFNVLLAAGGHSSGNGAIAKAKKFELKDPSVVDDLKLRGVSDEKIESLADVNEYLKYFSDSYIEDFSTFGFLGDWRRFILTHSKDYGKFIEWQFKKLKNLGYIIQKPYYANCCIVDGPVAVDPAEMDLSCGGNAEQTEYTLIKLEYNDNNNLNSNLKQYVVVATLRPETMFGQTNVWLDYNIEYVKIKITPTNNKEEIWIVSKEFANKIKYQIDNVEKIGSINGKELVGTKCLAPFVNREIPILPSDFCDPNIGTGIVTSVPSDAPADYIGLKDLQESKELCEKYNLNQNELKEIRLIPIIKSKGHGDFPAVEICEKYGIKSQ